MIDFDTGIKDIPKGKGEVVLRKQRMKIWFLNL